MHVASVDCLKMAVHSCFYGSMLNEYIIMRILYKQIALYISSLHMLREIILILLLLYQIVIMAFPARASEA